jgi:hypothetical protein
MPTPQLKVLKSINASNQDKEDEFSIPLDISDILSICKEYNKLGWQIQKQVENILEFGVEDCIKYQYVKKESLLHIKNFLIAISKNPYFGDAVSQASDCLEIIREHEEKVKYQSTSSIN